MSKDLVAGTAVSTLTIFNKKENIMNGNERCCRKFNFTKTKIDTLPAHPRNAKSREQEYSDVQATGLRLLVSKSGRKFFHFRYRFKGRKQSMSIGEYGPISLMDARLKAQEYRRILLLEKKNPKFHNQTDLQEKTFQEFVQVEYIPFARDNKKSWSDDVSKFNKYMFPLLSKID